MCFRTPPHFPWWSWSQSQQVCRTLDKKVLKLGANVGHDEVTALYRLVLNLYPAGHLHT